MKNLFSRKNGSKGGGVKAPSYDPYGRFKNTGDGIFGFREDNHVIIPGVTSYEERRLEGVLKYVEKETGKECTLSQELINDIYSIYVNEDVKRRPQNGNNKVRHKVLDKVYDSLTKVVTVDSPLYTQILTRELALVLQEVDDEIQEKQEQDGDGASGEGGDSGSGLETSLGDSGGEEDGKGDSDGEGNEKGEDSNGESNSSSQQAGSGSGANRSSIEDIIDTALERAEQSIEQAKSKADDKIKELEKQLGQEAMKDLQHNEPEFLEKIDELKSRLKSVTINKDSVRKVMEKILNESLNYFSSKFKIVEESLFDSEELEDLFGLEFLHPVFKNAEIMNIGNETRIYKGKIDLYLDCSGSMNSSEIFEGKSIRMIDLVKGIAMILYRMNMIENLYFFDGSLYKIDNINELTILSFSKSGGTNFNNVIDSIKKTGNNSVIITDGYDGCREYTKKAFWVGVGGTQFSRTGDAFESYRSSKQCVSYTHKGTLEYCVD